MTISHTEFNERKRVANELLRMHDEAGTDFVDWVKTWASRYAIERLVSTRPMTNRLPILEALAQAPLGGLTCRQLSEMTGIRAPLVSTALCGIVESEAAYVIKIPGRSRYFPTAMAMEAGRHVVESEEALRGASRIKVPAQPREKKLKAPKAERPPKAPKARKPPKPPKPKKHQAFRVREATVVIAKPKLPKLNESVFIPPHVTVQQLPHGLDTRYTATGTGEGGFLAEWRLKRGLVTEETTPEEPEGENDE